MEDNSLKESIQNILGLDNLENTTLSTDDEWIHIMGANNSPTFSYSLNTGGTRTGTIKVANASNTSCYTSVTVTQAAAYLMYYTSTDGNIVTPYNTSAFGANLVGNLYSGGQGILVFDGPITSIGDNAFQDCTSLSSVTIPNSVTSIGNYAFQGCSSLSSITIPSGVTSIKYQAFYNCTSLSSITIPNSVTSIGDYVFYQCTSLNSITIPNSVTSIGSNTFRGCTSLSSVTIPNSVTSIGSYTFQQCTGLSSVTIGSGITSIESSTFRGCTSLSSVTIPNSVTSIGSSAFNSCTSLSSVTIPNSVTSIGNYAFRFCSGLTAVTCNAVTPPTLGSNAFYSTNNCPIYVPAQSVYAYRGTTNWTTYKDRIWGPANAIIYQTNTNTVCPIRQERYGEDWDYVSPGDAWHSVYNEDYDEYAAVSSNTYYSSNGCGVILLDFTGNTSVFTLRGAYDDYDCLDYVACLENVTSIILPRCITSLTNYTFYNYDGGECPITYAVIPNSVTSIEDYVFVNCSSLSSVAIGSGVTSIYPETFNNCTSLSAFTGTHTGISSDHRCIGIGGELKVFAPSGLTTYTIPSTYSSIGGGVFANCTSLNSITIPNSVTSIGYWAFGSCTSLSSITIGNSVTSIGESAFDNCTSLSSITIGNSVTSIGNWAFSYCRGLSSVTIGSGVTIIGSYAFYGCGGLSNITCNAITPPTLGSNAFYNTNNCSIYVQTVFAYRNATNWSTYQYRIYPPKNAVSYRNETYSSDPTPRYTTYASWGAVYTGITGYNSEGLWHFNDTVQWVAGDPYGSPIGTDPDNIALSDGVTQIQAFGFAQVWNLGQYEKFIMPKSVTSITGNTIFYQVYQLNEIYFTSTTPPNIQSALFDPLIEYGITLYVPSTSVDRYKAASNWNDYKSYIQGYTIN